MAWRGSISRSLLAAGRSSSLRSPGATSALPRVRPPSLGGSRAQRSRLFGYSTRSLGELGCVQSLLPLPAAVAMPRLTSHLSASARACCELSQGKNGKDG